MICLWYFILFFKAGCFLFVGSDADCIEIIAEKIQREGIMSKIAPITAEGCVEICEDLNTCFAVNYFRLNATCQLLNRTMPESKLIKTTKCFYKAVRRPSQESIDNDPCFKLMCPWDEICMHNTTTNLAECYPFCKNPPTLPGTLSETIELEVGQNYTYKCQDGHFGKGDHIPTVTCLRDGHWTETNFTCARLNWKQDTIYYNNLHTSDVIINMTEIDLLECMRQCDDRQETCLSFFYDNHTSQCLLSSSFRRGLPQNLQSSEGLVYYTAPSTVCDMGYMNISLGGSNFCIKVYSILKTFNDAMRLCESEKAKILVITTLDQIADLKTHLYGWTYVGLSDENEEGTWVSWDGKAVNLPWYPPDPNGGTNENCGNIASDKIGFFDGDCLWGCTYLGISDETNEGNWVTWDGRVIFPSWNPDDSNGGTNVNCACIDPNYSGLRESPCELILYYVCSKL